MKNNVNKKGIIVLFLVTIMLFTGIGALLTNVVGTKNEEKNVYMTISQKEITKQEYEIFYILYVNEFVNTYGLYLDSWGLDINKDFALQSYDEENTWEDVFKQQTIKNIKQYVVLNEDAKKTNTKIEIEDQVDELMDIFATNAKTAGTDYESYLKSVFGPDVTEKDVRDAVSYQYSAIEYSNILNDTFEETITDKDLIALYSTAPATFDKVIYRMVTFDFNDDKEKAREDANAFRESITDEDSFVENAKQYTKDDTLFESVGTENVVNEDVSSFIFNDERKLGDNAIIEGEDAYYIVFFKSRNICEDRTVDFRHIYFNTKGANSEEKTQLKANADALFSTIKDDSELTEDKFSSYAFVYSDDTLTRNKGGLLEGVRNGDTDEVLDAWLFDENRKPGDIQLLESSIGYHIMYYVGENDIYWKKLARSYLISELYDEYLNNLLSALDKTEETAETTK